MSDKIKIPAVILTNHRTGEEVALHVRNGHPCCPHCDTEMVRVEDRWENAACPCWWHGMDTGLYTRQCVVAATPEAEEKYKRARAERSASLQADAVIATAEWDAQLELVKALGGHVRASHKRSRGRGGHPIAVLPDTAKDDPRVNRLKVCAASTPTGYFSRIEFFQTETTE